MRIKIVSEGSRKIDYLRGRWGLSILIDEDVLFDTFCDGAKLKHDLIKKNIDLKKIKHVIISHDHWDHTGGLWYILENNPDVRVYVCKNSSDQLKKKISGFARQLVEIVEPQEIRENIFTSGEIEACYKDKGIYEQSLILKSMNKMAVITGCSHPGIVKILNIINSQHAENIDFLIGGLHLMDKSMTDIAETINTLDSDFMIDNLYVFHCTGNKAINYLKKKMPQKIRNIKYHDCFVFNSEKLSWEAKRGNYNN